jgi:hypothetical protein
MLLLVLLARSFNSSILEGNRGSFLACFPALLFWKDRNVGFVKIVVQKSGGEPACSERRVMSRDRECDNVATMVKMVVVSITTAKRSAAATDPKRVVGRIL